MKRTSTPGSVNGLYSSGNPFLGQEGTIVGHEELNATQEEIARVIELTGATLDPSDSEQLFKAIGTMQGLTPAEKQALRSFELEGRTGIWVPGQRTPHVLAAMSCSNDFDATEQDLGYWVVGDQATAPTGATAEGGADYDLNGALQPGHAWPYFNVGMVQKHATLAYRWPACPAGWGINGYRETLALEPGMLGSRGGRLVLTYAGSARVANTRKIEVVIQPKFVTSVDGAGANTTVFDSNLRCSFVFTGLTSSNNWPFFLRIEAIADGPFWITWTCEIIIGPANITDPDGCGAADPVYAKKRILRKSYKTGACDFDNEHVPIAVLLKVDDSAQGAYVIGTAAAAQDGVNRLNIKQMHAVLYPGV